MKLQGRYLKLEMCGEDVALLHQELQKLGFTIPEHERIQSCFGEGTFAAVKDFQTKHQIKVTGVVDAQTATAINQAVDALEQYVVVGKVTNKQDGSAYTDGVVKGHDKDLRRKKSTESNSVRSAMFIAKGQQNFENSVGVACL
jgi:peptidoglycan hydrolase-like protein with peptidoglycan-binding domain